MNGKQGGREKARKIPTNSWDFWDRGPFVLRWFSAWASPAALALHELGALTQPRSPAADMCRVIWKFAFYGNEKAAPSWGHQLGAAGVYQSSARMPFLVALSLPLSLPTFFCCMALPLSSGG